MPKNKTKNFSRNTNEQPLAVEKSELSSFVEHTLPPEEDVRRFDNYLKEGDTKKSLNDSLSKIYEGDDGKRINVQEVHIKKRRNVWLRAALIALYIAIAGGLVFAAYYWLTARQGNEAALDLSISAPGDLKTNEEFSYTLVYQNKENAVLTGLELSVTYPENFIFTSSTPAAAESNSKWRLGDLQPFSTGQIVITGRLIAQPGQSNILFADLSYSPQGITSTFKKSASVDVILSSSGFEISALGPGTALIGQEQSISVSWKPEEENYLSSFTLRLEALPNMEIMKGQSYPAGIIEKEPGVFEINTQSLAKPLVIKFKFKEKKNDNENLKLVFEYTPQVSGRNYRFEEKVFPVEVVSNSLNLTISANGQSIDQGVNFGQPINYSISYANKGEQPMNDVIIMAVIEGDAVDWRELADVHNGKVVGSTIVWTKSEVPELKSIARGQEGSIDFSVPVRPGNEAPLIKQYEINGYAQFALGDRTEELSSENSADRSNQLSLKINSDVSLDEAARYFDENNMAVGTGPLPPQAGETTTVKIYWKITNSLHELGDLKVTTTLPANVRFDNKNLANAGNLYYDANANQVVWDIGRMPLSVTSLSAEFSVAVTPTAADRNKLMVLVSGTTLGAKDNLTGFNISQVLKAQTTKLDKDDIADTDGIVQ